MVLLFRIAGWLLIVIGAAVATYPAVNEFRDEPGRATVFILFGAGASWYGWLLARKPEAEDDGLQETEEPDEDEDWGW